MYMDNKYIKEISDVISTERYTGYRLKLSGLWELILCINIQLY